MKWGSKEKERICGRVKQVREGKFGNGHGAPKAMAKELGIPYTTYRGYEKNRMNNDFLLMLAKKFKIDLRWLMTGEIEDEETTPSPGKPRIITDPEQFIINRGQYQIVTMPDESMTPAIRKDALVMVSKHKIENPNLKIIVFTDSNGEIRIRRSIFRGKKLLGLPDNPMFKQSITIDPTKIIGEAVFQFSVI